MPSEARLKLLEREKEGRGPLAVGRFMAAERDSPTAKTRERLDPKELRKLVKKLLE